ncbi:TrgA family protein [Thalassovita sp.]|uniref:TrgA family protein n=1 Tax=Thalassovita sp. TaxID=1979401 RepID=UPI0029DE591C|nr:TrgA family protein [Thalassovita sp.]
MMPTAARLIAALVLAATAWAVSQTVKPYLPEGTQFGWFDYVNAGLGVIFGWRTVGARAGRGMSAAIGNGLTGMVVMVFWALFVQSAYKMVGNSLRRWYDGPVEALLDMFQIGFDWAQLLINPDVAGLLIVGGILAGVLSELASRVWR